MALTQVKAEGIATGAVTTPKLLDDAVSNAKLTSSTNEANRAVGADTVQDDAIGIAALSATGTASSSTFLRGDNSWQTVSTTDSTKMPLAGGTFTGDVVFDNSTNADNDLHWDESADMLKWDDNVKAVFGDGNDLLLYHDGTDSYLKNITGGLVIQGGTQNNSIYIRPRDGENSIQANSNGSVDLYYDNIKTFNSASTGIEVRGPEGSNCELYMYADEGDDNADLWKFVADVNGGFSVQNKTSGSWENSITAIGNGATDLYYDNSKKLHTYSDGCKIEGELILKGAEGGETWINWWADEGDDANDHWRSGASTSNDWYLQNYSTSSWDTNIRCYGGGAVELYHNDGKKLNTWAYGIEVVADSPHITMKTSNGTSRGNVYANTDNYIGFLDDGGNWILKCKKSTETFLYLSNFAPSGDDSNHIGTSSYRWDNIYATNGTIQTSDRNEKNTIVDSDLGLSFINKLKPVSYKFNGKTRTHYGLIAQDVETTLDGKDFAGFIKSDIPEIKYEEKEDLPSGKSVGDVKTAAHTSYGLRYNEFIGPLVKAIQELSTEVETLKTKVAALEAA